MLLSLGGNIVPSQVSEYRISSGAINYDGMMSKTRTRRNTSRDDDDVRINPGANDV